MRLKSLMITACAVWNLMLCTAHAFSETVRFEGDTDKGILLQSVGMADKAKEAKDEAVRNAFRALFYEGVEGLNGGMPMLKEKNKSFDYRFFENQYPNYLITPPTVVSERKEGNQRRAGMLVEIDIKKLKKTAVAGGCALTSEWADGTTQENAAAAVRPSIVVIPYISDPDADFEAMVGHVREDETARTAVNAVSAHFSKMGYKTKDFVTLLQNSKTGGLTASGTQTDAMTELVKQLPGDIVVTVNATIDTNGEMSQCNLNLKAVERHTGDQLAIQDFISGRYRITDPTKLVAHAIEKMPDDFFTQLDNSFKRRKDEGLAMIVEFQLSESVSDWNFDAPIPSSGDDFKTLLAMWMRQQAANNSYTRTASTDKYIQNSIKIPLGESEGGKSCGPDTFASELKEAVRKMLDDEYGVKITEMGQRLIVTID